MKSVEPSGFQFTNPLLMEMHFSVNKDYIAKADEEKVDIPIEMEVARADNDNGQDNVAFVKLKVNIGAQTPEYPYFISVTMGANFRWDSSVQSEIVDTLLSKNAPALLLGYLRPYIAQITEASPIGAVHIPFMDFSRSESE